MHVVLLIDASSSMMFEDKLLRAQQLAAAFGVMGLFNVERVSAYTFHNADGPLPKLPPCTGRGSMTKLFRFLESYKTMQFSCESIALPVPIIIRTFCNCQILDLGIKEMCKYCDRNERWWDWFRMVS